MSSRTATEGDESPVDVADEDDAGDATAEGPKIPQDLIFDDIQGWIKQNLENATKDMVKR